MTFSLLRHESVKPITRYYISILLIISGSLIFLGINLLASKVPFYFGLILIIEGFYLNFKNHEEKISSNYENLISIGISRHFRNVGFILLFSVLFFESMLSDDVFGDYTLLLIIFSVFLFCYNALPSQYAKEKEYLLLFQFFLSFFLLFPYISYFLLEISHIPLDLKREYIFEKILTIPLIKLLSAFGFNVFGEGNMLHYHDSKGNLKFVTITEGCSGIYSVVLFFAAFFSFAILEYRVFDYFLISFCLLGFFVSYFANLLRMSIIIVVGIYTDESTMFWVHSNVGWLIFFIWISIFWPIFTKLADRNFNRGVPHKIKE